jgi:Malectin domain
MIQTAVISFILLVISINAAYPAPSYTCSRNFYVATTGTDSATCGATGSQCATIQGANNATSIGGTGTTLRGGDCVNVAAGTYNTANTISLTKSGNANQANGYVTYIGAPNHASIINFVTGGAFRGIQIVAPAAYIWLDGFDVNGNDILPGEMIGDVGGTPAPHHLVFTNNLIHNAKAGGIVFHYLDYYWVYNNIVHDTMWGVGYGESGIYLYQARAIPGFTPTLPWDTQTYHIQIVDNISYNNGCIRETTGAMCGTGNHSDGNGFNADEWDNQRTNGQFPTYPYRSLWAGNVAYGNGGRGFEFFGSSNIDAYNNTTWGNGRDTFGQVPEEEIAMSGSNNNIINNIMIATNSTENGKAFRWYGSEAGKPDTGNVIINNFTWNGSSGSQALLIQGTSNDAAHLAQIQAASANNHLGVNPQLANPPSDFHPASGSPVIGAGAAFTSTTVLPNPANITPDGFTMASNPSTIGAYNSTAAAPANTVAGPVQISAGGVAATPFIADAGFNGGTASGPYAGSIDTSLVVIPLTPAPLSVYRYQRFGTSFNYVISSLTPLSYYQVVLHFIEHSNTAVGQRKINATINGAQVLSAFDIFAATGAQHKATAVSFNASADTNGKITIAFSGTAGLTDTNATVSGIEVLAGAGPVSINSGGPVVPPYTADAYYSGGQVGGPQTTPVDVSLITPQAPPTAIFLSERYGANFNYVVPGFTPGNPVVVNLWFTEDWDTASGQRLEDITINGLPALTSFDIFAAAGAQHKAILRQLLSSADGNGTVTINFASSVGSTDSNAKVDAINVLLPTNISLSGACQ